MEFLSILFRVNVSLFIFFAVYRLALRRLTFYNFNRVYLLASVLLSVVIPLLQYSDIVSNRINTLQSAVGMPAGDFRQLLQHGFEWDWISIVTTIYWSGVVVFAAIFLVQLLSLLSLYIRSKRATAWGYRIRTIDEQLQPFSFFKSIFINPASHTIPEQLFILEHEAVHIRQWHSLDIIVGELKRIFCWFNPASWLILGAIRENLEYIADRKVLQTGINAKEYQYALLAVKQQEQRNSLTNNFNFSHLKLRITMMNKSKSSDLHLIKYLMIVPVIAMASIATNFAHAQKIELKAVEKSGDIVHLQPNTTFIAAQSVKDTAALRAKAMELLHSDNDEVDSSKVSLKLVRVDNDGKFTMDEGHYDNLNEAVGSFIDKLASGKMLRIKMRDDKGTIITADNFTFMEPAEVFIDMSKSTETSNRENRLVIVDGKETASIFDVNADDVESITILKGANAKALRPDIDDETGIIQIKTKGKKALSTPLAQQAFDVSIYPNPATSSVQVKVNSNDANNSYQMYDRHGKMVAEGKLSSTTKISTDGMDTGTYFIKMKIEGTIKEGKVELIK